MNRKERLEIKASFTPSLWKRFKDRVEVVRGDRLAEGMPAGEAAVAWDIVIAEPPFAEAYVISLEADDGEAEPEEPPLKLVAPPEPEPQEPEPPQPRPQELEDDTEAQGVDQSARANIMWVTSVTHRKKVLRKDAPNEAAFNLYTWVKADPKNMDALMGRQLQMGGTKDGQGSDKFGDDGRPALDTVDRTLDKEYGKKHAEGRQEQFDKGEEPNAEPDGPAKEGDARCGEDGQ